MGLSNADGPIFSGGDLNVDRLASDGDGLLKQLEDRIVAVVEGAGGGAGGEGGGGATAGSARRFCLYALWRCKRTGIKEIPRTVLIRIQASAHLTPEVKKLSMAKTPIAASTELVNHKRICPLPFFSPRL